MHDVQCFLNLFLHYILSIFQVDEIIGGGGGQNDMFAPPSPPKKYFHWGGGGGATAPQLPQDRRLWGQATWTSKGGDVYSGGSRDLQKKGVGGKIRARASYGWGPGARP